MMESSQSEATSELTPSKLGTKEHWDETYDQEYQTFLDTGEVEDTWYGPDSVDRLLAWMEGSDLVCDGSSILDLGCGNGYTLVELGNNSYKNLWGVDYSQKGINLAQQLTKQNNLDIKFEVCDILQNLPDKDSDKIMSKTYDVCLDKGTYDAISLSEDSQAFNRQKYISHVHSVLEAKGILILTSCNWTPEELKIQFAAKFEIVDYVPAPTFQFGGVKGNRETCVVFRAL